MNKNSKIEMSRMSNAALLKWVSTWATRGVVWLWITLGLGSASFSFRQLTLSLVCDGLNQEVARTYDR